MILRTTNVTSVLEGDPWMPGFEKYFEHLLPKVDRRNLFTPDFTVFGLFFVLDVLFLKLPSVNLVKIRDLIASE